MIISAREIVARAAEGLPPVVLVYGGEPLLVEETLDVLRGVLADHQFEERIRFDVDARFDWGTLEADSSAMSLFSSRRCFELRMPGGKPGDKGSAAITRISEATDSQDLFILITGRLDRRQLQLKWVKSIEKSGWLVDCGEVNATAFPAWLRKRLESRGLRVANGVHELLAYYLEGNLLAAAQEVDKLKVLASDGAVTIELVKSSLGDQARFSTYALVDACLLGEAARAARMLASLRSEGARPELVVWTLAREVRAMFRIAGAIEQGVPRGAVYKANRVWSRREPVVEAALGRFSMQDWCTMIRRVTHLDQMAKGQAGPVPRDGIWQEAEAICLVLSGAKVLEAPGFGTRYGTS